MSRYFYPSSLVFYHWGWEWSQNRDSSPGQSSSAATPSFSHSCYLISSLIQFGSSMLDVGMDVSLPEPPWDPLPIFPGKISFVILLSFQKLIFPLFPRNYVIPCVLAPPRECLCTPLPFNSSWVPSPLPQ